MSCACTSAARLLINSAHKGKDTIYFLCSCSGWLADKSANFNMSSLKGNLQLETHELYFYWNIWDVFSDVGANLLIGGVCSLFP